MHLEHGLLRGCCGLWSGTNEITGSWAGGVLEGLPTHCGGLWMWAQELPGEDSSGSSCRVAAAPVVGSC